MTRRLDNEYEIQRSENTTLEIPNRINNEAWFVGKDIAEVLEYKDTSDALKRHIDEDDKGVNEMDTPGGIQKLKLINESGLYRR